MHKIRKNWKRPGRWGVITPSMEKVHKKPIFSKKASLIWIIESTSSRTYLIYFTVACSQIMLMVIRAGTHHIYIVDPSLPRLNFPKKNPFWYIYLGNKYYKNKELLSGIIPKIVAFGTCIFYIFTLNLSFMFPCKFVIKLLIFMLSIFYIYTFYFWNRKLYIYAFYFQNRKLYIYAFYFLYLYFLFLKQEVVYLCFLFLKQEVIYLCFLFLHYK